jgi:hypothetical protein
MKRVARSLTLALLGMALAASCARAIEYDKYEIESVSAALSSTQAGAHADFTASVSLSDHDGVAYAKTKDVVVTLPPGLFGNPQAFPKCTVSEMGLTPETSACPMDAQIGSTDLTISGLITTKIVNQPIYNMPAPGGDIVARFGFFAGEAPIYLNVRLDPGTHDLVASVENSPSAVELVEAVTTFWGVPAAKSHDPERLTPEESFRETGPPGGHSSDLPEVPFMTNPTSCEPGRSVSFSVTSYQSPDQPRSRTAAFPQITGCEAVDFSPTTTLRPTTFQGTSGSGLEYRLELPTDGLRLPAVNYGSELRRAEVVLPQGMTINPSQAEGLGVCTTDDFARETYNSGPNAGCPEASKIGSVLAETPVLDRVAEGSLYVAKPYENPFGSLLALYVVLKVPDRGVLVKLPGKVTLDPKTGQITTVFDEVPQLPLASFKLSFREGVRAPLVTPPACGSYQGLSHLAPWSSPGSPATKANSFSIESGPDHGPCPGGALPPFRPALVAGTTNNAAGAFAPFDFEITRNDSEQELTGFSIKLPPGLSAKLAGVASCPDLAIAAAAGRTVGHGAEEELASPPCPAASQVGTTWAGVGVGQVLTYVPGRVYLAGPYHGAPISIVAVTAAKAGPFDLGTVVVREALRIDPQTAEVFVDAAGSDPIPHIIAGVPVHLRDLRAYIDRPQFTLNPTSCKRTSTAGTLLGTGADFALAGDDEPVTVTSPFQAADCASHGFKPDLKLFLIGGTKRGDNPKLRAVLKPRKGDANIRQAQVTLPHSEFLDNEHLKTICTRVQFAAGDVPGEKCPTASIYGYARAFTPLLDQPIEGPVFLRSSSHPLPDLVAALHSDRIDINLDGRIDSFGGDRIRTTFSGLPDVPVVKFVLNMQGGKKGLLVNSTDICRGRHRALVGLHGQNEKRVLANSVIKTKCRKK